MRRCRAREETLLKNKSDRSIDARVMRARVERTPLLRNYFFFVCFVLRCESFFPEKKNFGAFFLTKTRRKKSGSFSPITPIFFPKKHTRITQTHRQQRITKSTMPYASESFLRTAAREGKKMWPFLAGFAFVGTAVTYSTLTITSEDKKASKFLNPGGH